MLVEKEGFLNRMRTDKDFKDCKEALEV